MSNWTAIVQLRESGGRRECSRFDLGGVPYPFRIYVHAGDPSADQAARDVYRELESRMRASAASGGPCSGPVHPGCQAERQPSCVHVMVSIIASGWSGARETLWRQWVALPGLEQLVVPALLPPLSHAQAFAAAPPDLAAFQIASWGGAPSRLAAEALERATREERPSAFLSYRRSDGDKAAGQLFDALSQSGMRVFVDRFSMTSGRVFPREIAEEIAGRDVMIMLETPDYSNSRWTRWEVSFAHQYRIGVIALHDPAGPAVRGANARRTVAMTGASGFASGDLVGSVDFVRREFSLARLRRRAFYETLIAGAAKAATRTTKRLGDGIIEITSGGAGRHGLVLPVGRPGVSGDIRRLTDAGGAAAPRLVVGQHGHLPARARSDLEWFAGKFGVTLAGRYDAFNRVKALP